MLGVKTLVLPETRPKFKEEAYKKALDIMWLAMLNADALGSVSDDEVLCIALLVGTESETSKALKGVTSPRE